MACMRIGSKSEASLRLEGQTWVCSSGLASDVTIQVGELSFQLHKFPLISRSGLLEKRIGDSTTTTEDGPACLVKLDDLPGGSKAFELISKFCYGIKFELNSSNVVSLRCSSEFLEMTEEFGEGNLIAQTEAFLSEVFASWQDSMTALVTCEEVLPQAEANGVVSRCINSLAMKACSDPALFGWPISGGGKTSKDRALWNGITSGAKQDASSSGSITDDWWFEDVSSLSFPLYKRFIKGVESRGMKPERVSGSIMFYARKNIPSMVTSKQDMIDCSESTEEEDQRSLLEEVVGLLPAQKGVTQTKFLLKLLKTAMGLHTGQSCIESLERRAGAQLDQASLVDLLIPNMGLASDTLYDMDCVQRIVDHFIQMQQNCIVSETSSPVGGIEDSGVAGSQSVASMTSVADLVDSYLAEVAPDVNVKPAKFQALAAAVPDYARTRYDGFYRAVDIYLKAHPWLTESEREQICRLMNCQKLSLEASTHAAQNERLPLRVVVQVLFFEQLRLRTQISGWFFVSDSNLDSRNNADEPIDERALVLVGDMRERVTDIEKEFVIMRKEIQKLTKGKKRWNIFSKMFASRPKQQKPANLIESKSANPKIVQLQVPSNVGKKQDHGMIAKGADLEITNAN